jgi:hypothetical protein
LILLVPALYRALLGYSSVPSSLQKLVTFMALATIPLLLAGACVVAAEFAGFIHQDLKISARPHTEISSDGFKEILK